MKIFNPSNKNQNHLTRVNLSVLLQYQPLLALAINVYELRLQFHTLNYEYNYVDDSGYIYKEEVNIFAVSFSNAHILQSATRYPSHKLKSKQTLLWLDR